MKDVEINKNKLLERLRENRAHHRTLYKKAWLAYEIRVIKETKQLLKYLKANGAKKNNKLYVLQGLPRPEDHTADYDIAISMLEVEERPTVIVDHHEYRRYYLDEWSWMPVSITTNNFYAVN